MEPILKVQGLQKSFVLHTQNGVTLKVLDEIDIVAGRGEILALCGPSGAGKSSLLKSIYGTYRVNGGRVNICSSNGWVDIAKAEPREIDTLRLHTMGYVSQFLRVIPRVATIDIVSNSAIESGIPEIVARELAEELLLRLRIPIALHGLSPTTFSGGEQQRVNIARAIIAPRPLMLFDEPTASLDLENRNTVLEMILDLAKSGAAVVGIFHNSEDRLFLHAREINLSTTEGLENA